MKEVNREREREGRVYERDREGPMLNDQAK